MDKIRGVRGMVVAHSVMCQRRRERCKMLLLAAYKLPRAQASRHASRVNFLSISRNLMIQAVSRCDMVGESSSMSLDLLRNSLLISVENYRRSSHLERTYS